MWKKHGVIGLMVSSVLVTTAYGMSGKDINSPIDTRIRMWAEAQLDEESDELQGELRESFYRALERLDTKAKEEAMLTCRALEELQWTLIGQADQTFDFYMQEILSEMDQIRLETEWLCTELEQQYAFMDEQQNRLELPGVNDGLLNPEIDLDVVQPPSQDSLADEGKENECDGANGEEKEEVDDPQDRTEEEITEDSKEETNQGPNEEIDEETNEGPNEEISEETNEGPNEEISEETNEESNEEIDEELKME